MCRVAIGNRDSDRSSRCNLTRCRIGCHQSRPRVRTAHAAAPLWCWKHAIAESTAPCFALGSTGNESSSYGVRFLVAARPLSFPVSACSRVGGVALSVSDWRSTSKGRYSARVATGLDARKTRDEATPMPIESRELGCNYIARRRTGSIGRSDRGDRRLPVTRVGPMSISSSRIARRSVFRCTPSLSAALH